MPIRPPAVTACDQGMPISQHTGAMIQPSARCNRQRRAEQIRQQAEDRIGEITSAMNTISMATMLSRSSRPAPVPLTMASMVLSRDLLDVAERAAGVLRLRVGHHDAG